MTAAASSPADLVHHAARLQVLTVSWMALEAVAAITSALVAQSPALLAFGGDSAIELFSASIVLWRFRTRSDSAKAERLAARVAGVLLIALAVVVIATSAASLLGYREPRRTLVGITILIAAAVGMPWLASEKRKLASQLASASLKADAAESALCGYMAWIALAGLLLNAFLHVPWADPVAALALIPFIVNEAREALLSPRPCCGDGS